MSIIKLFFVSSLHWKRLTSPAFNIWCFLYFTQCFWKQIVICNMWRTKIISIIKLFFVSSWNRKRLTFLAFKIWSFLYFILCLWKQIVICHLWRTKVKSVINLFFLSIPKTENVRHLQLLNSDPFYTSSCVSESRSWSVTYGEQR